MTTYRVDIDGTTVWEGQSDDYDRSTFPAEYRARPDQGAVHLYVDDELIAVQTPLEEN